MTTSSQAPSSQHDTHKIRAALLVVICSLALFGLTMGFTRFASVDQVLSAHEWEAGKPTSTWITAFATLRPWWHKWEPEAVRVTPDGGIEHVVYIPRTEIAAKQDKQALPKRSIGYDLVLGVITAFRSAFSPDLVYDFALFVRFQHVLLAASLVFTLVALAAAHPAFRKPAPVMAFAATYIALLFLRPNEAIFLNAGIIDSALANPAALAAVGALVWIVRGARLDSRRRAAALVAASLFLGYCTLVRGEFVVVFAVAYSFLAAAALLTDRRLARGLCLSFALLLAPLVTYGLVNLALFDRFVPFRMQSGQNLVEPIGQYPNPYGIEWSDEWMARFLDERDIPYISFEADRYLTRMYLDLLVSNPLLFVRNFYYRLRDFPLRITLGLNAWTIPLAVAAALFAIQRDPRALYAALPCAVAIGVLLFCGWFNSMFRLLTPVHFLTNVALCYGAAYAAVWLRDWREAHSNPRNGAL